MKFTVTFYTDHSMHKYDGNVYASNITEGRQAFSKKLLETEFTVDEDGFIVRTSAIVKFKLEVVK
ncbi:hypothetical protein ABEW81_11180 [Priestia megaterium]